MSLMREPQSSNVWKSVLVTCLVDDHDLQFVNGGAQERCEEWGGGPRTLARGHVNLLIA